MGVAASLPGYATGQNGQLTIKQFKSFKTYLSSALYIVGWAI